MNVTINSYPGKLYESTNIYSRRILILGKVILVILHELLGHYMRRYYSYMTHGAIAFDTSNDKILDTGEEGGFFVEKIFLGLNKSDKSKLTISEALILFYWDNFKDYPIKKNNRDFLNREMLENVFKIWRVCLVEDITRGNNKSKANILNEAKELFKSVHDSDTLIDKEKHFPN